MNHQNNAYQEIWSEENELLAILLSWQDFSEGVNFVTPNDLQQQVAVMNRASGEVISAHTHLPVPRSLRGTQEVLVILSGLIKARIYDNRRILVSQLDLLSGHVLILVAGGHGFTIAEDARFIEVKQGPYVPGKDKEIFDENGDF